MYLSIYGDYSILLHAKDLYAAIFLPNKEVFTPFTVHGTKIYSYRYIWINHL
jgi:hypothetical protein